jgi:hypothetical protein
MSLFCGTNTALWYIYHLWFMSESHLVLFFPLHFHFELDNLPRCGVATVETYDVLKGAVVTSQRPADLLAGGPSPQLVPRYTCVPNSWKISHTDASFGVRYCLWSGCGAFEFVDSI